MSPADVACFARLFDRALTNVREWGLKVPGLSMMEDPMRASCVEYMILFGGVVSAIGCGSSTTTPASPSEAGVSEAAVLSDARRDLTTEGGALALSLVGDPCTQDNTCVTGSCNAPDMTGFTNGYCTYDCRPGRLACPVKTSCIALNGDTPFCYKNCTSDTDCRTADGYICLDVGAPLVLTGQQKVCYPGTAAALNCNYDTDCPPSFPHCTGGTGFMSQPDAGVDDAGRVIRPSTFAQPGNGTCGP
ncbi:MAG: hypothetical protein M3O50_21810 [Myxococcota bacterium]|nr:hypothetical protein [Myxococcota bacterium]